LPHLFRLAFYNPEALLPPGDDEGEGDDPA
jgi:hypothetical protein